MIITLIMRASRLPVHFIVENIGAIFSYEDGTSGIFVQGETFIVDETADQIIKIIEEQREKVSAKFGRVFLT